jgi:N utilization substance protein B
MLYPLALGEVGEGLEQEMASFWEHFEAPGDARAYADALVRGVAAHLGEIDEALRSASANWRLERMAKVDLAILRLAAYELLYEPEVPAEVVVDEAIELTKRFSTLEATSFVNGVLSPIVGQRQRAEKA